MTARQTIISFFSRLRFADVSFFCKRIAVNLNGANLSNLGETVIIFVLNKLMDQRSFYEGYKAIAFKNLSPRGS